jgi:hypothetical protein
MNSWQAEHMWWSGLQSITDYGTAWPPKSIVLVKLIKHIKTLNWKFFYKSPKNSTSTEEKLFIWEIVMQENFTFL